MTQKPVRAWAVALVVLGMLSVGCRPADDPRPRGSLEDIGTLRERSDLNVLFILVDTLRAQHLGTYGYERDTSPVIDELARSGVRFARHVSQSSWTKCSMASLWTGLYPNRTGVLHAQDAVSEAARLPAEIFREAGYRTAAIWRNGWIAPNFGFAQGFEIYLSPVGFAPESVRRANPEKIAAGDGDVIRSASVFLRMHARERWFLYLHLMDVHQYTYDADSALFGSSYSDSYDNAIHRVDSLLGHLLAELGRLGLRDRTLIVIAGDHGESFGEHGGEGHARNVYGEVTETPLILSFPFRLEPGLVLETRTQNVDLWPTILDLVGLPGLPDPDGRSLVAAIENAGRAGVEPEADVPAFAELLANWSRSREEGSQKPIVALNSDRWRLVYDGRVPERPQLFDKEADPAELRDLAAQEPEVTGELMAHVQRYLERSDSPWGGKAPIVEIDDMQLQQLRAIGYGVR